MTNILTLREIQMAQIVAEGVPYKEIAEQLHLSVGLVNNTMSKMYDILLIPKTNFTVLLFYSIYSLRRFQRPPSS
jgi:ATP/maltotriose-dependent transcriptional regulator MalT